MLRYKTILIDSDDNENRYITNPVYPEIPPTEDDIYVISTAGDRYDTLALQFYQDSSLWWIIASANTSNRSSLVVTPGVQLRIPGDKSAILELFEQVNRTR
jgi:hypothetical protein